MVQLVPMGLFDLFSKSAPVEKTVDVEASLTPFNLASSLYGTLNAPTAIDRATAMSVPAVSRARNIICGTIGSLPLEQYNRITGAHVEPLRVINQPDPRVSGFVVYNWLAEDIWMYGVGFGLVLDAYAEDGRVRAWTRIDPKRVTQKFNSNMTAIDGYQVDGVMAPIAGIGSIIRFDGYDEGFLTRSGRTVAAAVELEKAALNYAKEPVPSMVLKSNGTNLTSERISKLLEAWRSARATRSTAFLNADVEMQSVGFDPKSLQLVEARQYVALEVARAAGIPAYFLSAETTSMTYSNATSERRSLVDFSLRPILSAIEERLSLPDISPSTTEVRFDLDDFLRGNALERAQVYQILTTIGAMSIEQVQEEEDLIR
jgi:HK97 family phage portal protein